jgi:23S rRNA pseudouridine1911/1915/1917 synthase
MVAAAAGAPRLALHAAELGFLHPVTSETLFFEMPPPPDLTAFIDRIRSAKGVRPPKITGPDPVFG